MGDPFSSPFLFSHFSSSQLQDCPSACALEAVRIGALCWRGTFASTGDGLQVHHLASSARPKDDAVRLGFRYWQRSLQSKLIGHRLLDDGALEEVWVVARVQTRGVGER